MSNIRLLKTKEEITDATRLYMSHDSLQRAPHVKNYNDIDAMLSVGIDIVGSYNDDGELTAFATNKLFPQLPVHRIGNIYIKKDEFNLYFFNNKNHPTPKIMDFILERAESMGYFSWYYSRANLPVYSNLEKRGQDLLKCCKYGYHADEYRYDRYVDEIIAPFSFSKFDSFNKMFMLGDNIHELLLFQCVLKNKYRGNFTNEL